MVDTGLLHQDASLPAQYWEMFARTPDIAPEKRLLIAVLEEAIKTYRALVFTGGRRFAEAEEWILSDDNRYTFSFCSICDILGLSATRVRKSLRVWAASEALRPAEKQKRAARPAPIRQREESSRGAARLEYDQPTVLVSFGG